MEKHKFMFFTKIHQTVQIVCKENHKFVLLPGGYIVTMGHKCKFMSQEHETETHTELSKNITVSGKFVLWNTQFVFDDMSDPEITNLIEILGNKTGHAIEVRDIATLYNIKKVGHVSAMSSGLNSLIIGCVICAIIVLICCIRKNKKTGTDIKMQLNLNENKPEKVVKYSKKEQKVRAQTEALLKQEDLESRLANLSFQNQKLADRQNNLEFSRANSMANLHKSTQSVNNGNPFQTAAEQQKLLGDALTVTETNGVNMGT
jgi:hypothetical protein